MKSSPFTLILLAFCLGNSECPIESDLEEAPVSDIEFQMLTGDEADYGARDDVPVPEVQIDIPPDRLVPNGHLMQLPDQHLAMIIVLLVQTPADIARYRGINHRLDALLAPPELGALYWNARRTVISHLFRQMAMVPAALADGSVPFERLYRAMFVIAPVSHEVVQRVQRGSWWRTERVPERDELMAEIRQLTSGVQDLPLLLREVRDDLGRVQDIPEQSCWPCSSHSNAADLTINQVFELAQSYQQFLRNQPRLQAPAARAVRNLNFFEKAGRMMHIGGGGSRVHAWRSWLEEEVDDYTGIYSNSGNCCQKTPGGAVAGVLMVPVLVVDFGFLLAAGPGSRSANEVSPVTQGLGGAIAQISLGMGSSLARGTGFILGSMADAASYYGGNRSAAGPFVTDLFGTVIEGVGIPVGFALGLVRASGLAIKTTWFGGCRLIGGMVDCVFS